MTVLQPSTEVHTAVRNAFPALRRVHNGFPVAYFDGPGGTQVPRYVVDRMGDYLINHNANTHWVYPSSVETDEMILAARSSVAAFLNCDSSEVVFGANMTTLTFHLARALGARLSSGDEIIVTDLDHHANVAPWMRLQQERGVVVKSCRMVPESGQLDWDDLASKLSTRTKLLAIGAASNALGTVTDVEKATDLAHSFGAKVFVDAVHYAPHNLVDVKQIGCDFLACSAYKFYGPHIGILFGKHELLEDLDVPKLIPAPDSAPERIETGTLNHEGIVGAGAAVDFLAGIANGVPSAPSSATRGDLVQSYRFLHTAGEALTHQLWQGLVDITGVRAYGPLPGDDDHPRTPTVSFTLKGHSSEDVCRRLASKGLFASNGDFYATTVVQRLGIEGLIRIGCACYTTQEEVTRLIEAVFNITKPQGAN